MENVVIIGGGVTGHSAAIYLSRANLKPLVIEGVKAGGQLMLTTDVENFPGFPDGIKGPELVQAMKKQAEKFGARYKTADAKGFRKIKDGFEIDLGDEKIQAKSVIIATGADAKWLGLADEDKYKGMGIHSCATCDGFFYQGKEVFMVGGGDSALEEAMFLTKFVKKITIIHRRDELRASKIMQDKAKKNPKIEFMWDSVIEKYVGDKKLTGVIIKNVKTGETKEHKIDGVFLAIGHIPNTKIFKGIIDMDELGYIKTDKRLHTNVPGVFAAGDCQDTIYRQAITASGTGAQAALEAEKYVES